MLPQELIKWTFDNLNPVIVTTSFGNRSAVLLHMIHQIHPNANIVWVDTQFNLRATLRFKSHLYEHFNLNLTCFKGEEWKGEIPLVGSLEHSKFVEQVKLAPFRHAIQHFKPHAWITGIRRDQTEHRKTLRNIDQVDGITKISPLLDWTSQQMDNYIERHNLPNETLYFDPTKVYDYRECGLHTTHLRTRCLTDD